MLLSFLVLLALAVVGVLLHLGRAASPSSTIPAAPAVEPAPLPKVPNDKLVVVLGAPYGEVLDAASRFVAAYPGAHIDLLRIEPGVVAAVFPADISVDWFYFCVNFLDCPLDVTYSSAVKVRGWATLPVVTRDEQAALPEPVMVFVSADDTEYAHVYLATSAGHNYKVSFQGNMVPVQVRESGVETYSPPPFSADELQQFTPESVAAAQL
ncbi:hypothetical protein F0P96_01555 [Hymenobacter busanensis]|uniref:Uncharacterized protein n=1 Tax=Hymenobacter busanensis TaxID=2607656 RepID=A0A7L4ZTY5_9BACT|nr:hypothetical protein [Hymenobacter busanensis]KAA9339339.1 hypothetical protein F0P96_01555 [Hymenobacter busanensis]QHJ06899.1 hypothetical protein GUY19_06195 [Hymenobacter busanensis]